MNYEIQRNDDDASQVADEEEWKSVARRKMLQFEQQLHEGEFGWLGGG